MKATNLPNAGYSTSASYAEKTRVGDSRKPGEAFDSLGYRCEAGRRLVRRKRLKALRERVRSRTLRSRGDSRARIVGDLNPLSCGWFGYFRRAIPSVFRDIDGFLRRGLRASCANRTSGSALDDA